MNSFVNRILITAIICLSPAMLSAEYIFLTDGSIIQGSIVREDAQTVTIQDQKGKKQKITRNQVMCILYTKLNMGKIFVQKKSGKSFTAYMVDEDQDTYTCRNKF